MKNFFNLLENMFAKALLSAERLDQKQKHVISFLVSNNTLDKIDALAQKRNISKADIFRNGLALLIITDQQFDQGRELGFSNNVEDLEVHVTEVF